MGEGELSETMRCKELETELSSFLDGELADAERREVEGHLAECPACSAIIEEQRQLKLAVRGHLLKTAIPSGLVERVRGALAASEPEIAPPPSFWSTLWPRVRAPFGVLLPVAAALVLVLGYVETVEPVINSAVTKHTRNLPLEVTGGPAEVQRWFDGKVPFAVATPRLEPIASLRGGRLSHLGDRDAAYLQYEQGEHKISVFVFDPAGLRLPYPRRHVIGGHEVFVDGTRGYYVAVFRDRGLGYAIAGNLDEPDFMRLVSAAVGQHP